MTARKWIPSRKKGGRGHFSHCKEGHPYAGQGPCEPCRRARDAKRHASKDVKAADTLRKKEARWAEAANLETCPLGDGFFADLWRGSLRLRTPGGNLIIGPTPAAALYFFLEETIGRKPPSRLPPPFRDLPDE